MDKPVAQKSQPSPLKHKLEEPFVDEIAKQQRIDSPLQNNSLTRNNDFLFSSPSSSQKSATKNGDLKHKLFTCKFPEYALGRYVGYRIAVSFSDC